jgi:hypothetical protein
MQSESSYVREIIVQSFAKILYNVAEKVKVCFGQKNHLDLKDIQNTL